MSKLLTTAISLAFITGCCDGPATSKHSGNKYYPVKVCSISDMTGESCIEYAAKHFEYSESVIKIKTLDDHEYLLNKNGWAVIITNK